MKPTLARPFSRLATPPSAPFQAANASHALRRRKRSPARRCVPALVALQSVDDRSAWALEIRVKHSRFLRGDLTRTMLTRRSLRRWRSRGLGRVKSTCTSKRAPRGQSRRRPSSTRSGHSSSRTATRGAEPARQPLLDAGFSISKLGALPSPHGASETAPWRTGCASSSRSRSPLAGGRDDGAQAAAAT